MSLLKNRNTHSKVSNGTFFMACFGFVLALSCWNLIPRPGVESVPPAVEARSLNQWTARDVPLTEHSSFFLFYFIFFSNFILFLNFT